MLIEEVEIAPNLRIYLNWNERMQDALRKRYWAVEHQWSAENENLRKQYEHWYNSLTAMQEQAKRLFVVTGNLPVAGDHFQMGGRPGYAGALLRIEKRLVFNSFDSPEVLLVYEVCAENIEDLEEYREGDLLDEDE